MMQNTERGINKRKKGIDTSNRIKAAASELFVQRGYDGVSIREIAKEVGIKENSLYNHFNNKSGILEALYNDFIIMARETKPSLDELDKKLDIMLTAEVFKISYLKQVTESAIRRRIRR